jgi:hypothetical protein
MKTQFLFAALFVAAVGTAQTAIKNYESPDLNFDVASDIQEHLLTLDIPDYGIAGNYSISGVLNNKLAGEVKSATISYNVDNGNTVSAKLATGALSRGADVTSFKSEAAVNLAVGNHIVKAWVSEINGEALANPEVVTTTVHIASRAATRHGLIEIFTSATCPPCATEMAKLDPKLNGTYYPNTGGNYNVIKYQMNWPSPGNDPSYNSHGNTRKSYYGINGIPDGRVNGKTGTYDTDAGIKASATAAATVDISAKLLVSGNKIEASATITPYVTSTVTVHQVLLQDYYTYNGSNGQTKYYSAMRKMNPDGGGAKNTSIKDGTPFDVKFDHTAVLATKPAQGSFDFWQISSLKYQYVVFVQDDQTKSILNSASGLASTVGIVDIPSDAQIGVYPNPAESYAVIGIKVQNQTKVSLKIYDISGKVVYSNESPVLNIGQNEININTSNFAPGVYTIVANTNSGILREKLVVN